MLSDLIKNINNGLIGYVKQVEGYSYSGGDTISIDYVKRSQYISEPRRQSICHILSMCSKAFNESHSDKALASDLLNYVNTINSLLGDLFGYKSKLQNAVIQSIINHSPEYIIYAGSKALLNSNAQSFKPPIQTTEVDCEEEVPLSQLAELTRSFTAMSLKFDNMEKELAELKVERQTLLVENSQLRSFRANDLNELSKLKGANGPESSAIKMREKNGPAKPRPLSSAT